MPIVRVNLNLGNRTASDKVSFWGIIKTDMTGNVNFPSPVPALSLVDTEVGKLALAIAAAQSGDHSKIAVMNAQENKVDNLLHQLGNHVESVANNAALSGADAKAIIAGAGMDAGKTKVKAPLPAAPLDLKATSVVEEEIEVKFKTARFAHAYMIEISSDLAAINSATNTTTNSATARVYINWQITDVCVKPKITLSGLASGTKYAIRILSVGTAGKSVPSAVVVVKVL